MITNAGRLVTLKSIAFGGIKLSAIAIGTGGRDPILNVPIAPSPDATDLSNKLFFEPRIQLVDIITPTTGLSPRLIIRHTFENILVPPIGVATNDISECGAYVQDPATGLFVLYWIKTFDPVTFRVPAAGTAVVRDSVTISEEIF